MVEKKIFVSEIVPSMRVESIFAVSEKQVRPTKGGASYVHLKLSDKTGFINAKIWENSSISFSEVPSQGVVEVKGRAEIFNDSLQLIVESIRMLDRSLVNPEDFLPTSLQDPKVMLKELKKLLKPLCGSSYGALVKAFFKNGKLLDAFCSAPAAKSVHHAYRGGLLEHTLGVVRLASIVSDIYKGLDKNLLLAGAFFHDIGKIREYSYDFTIDYTDEGRLIGHIVIGIQIIDELLREVFIPAEQVMLLKHLVLSHHGETEMGSVKLPMTKEAVVLHLIDDMDAKMSALERFYKEVPENEKWTAYVRWYDRYFFKHSPKTSSFEESQENSLRDGNQLSIEELLCRKSPDQKWESQK